MPTHLVADAVAALLETGFSASTISSVKMKVLSSPSCLDFRRRWGLRVVMSSCWRREELDHHSIYNLTLDCRTDSSGHEEVLAETGKRRRVSKSRVRMSVSDCQVRSPSSFVS